MIPKAKKAIERFSKKVTLKKVTQSVVDFEPVDTYSEIPIDAVIQPAEAEKLIVADIDYSLKYILIHTYSEIAINDRIVDDSITYKIIDLKNYGHFEAVGEEVK